MMTAQQVYRHSKTVWAVNASRWPGFMRSVAICVACAVLSNPAMAAEKNHKMSYEVYAGGINAVSAELGVDYQKKGHYDIALTAFTKGFLGTLAPWEGTFETRGWRNASGMDQPELHRSVATWRGEDEVKEYSYNRKGDFVSYKITDHENKADNAQPDDALTAGTIDVLTATLHAMQTIGKGGNCEGTTEIFDGSRRFKLTFRFEADEVLSATRYNVYQGPSQRCVAEVTPAGGKWHDKPRGCLSIQEQGRQNGSLPTVWFAKLDESGPAVPVKVRVKSDYGAMFMHLVNYSNGESQMSASVMDDIREENAKLAAENAAENAAEKADAGGQQAGTVTADNAETRLKTND